MGSIFTFFSFFTFGVTGAVKTLLYASLILWTSSPGLRSQEASQMRSIAGQPILSRSNVTDKQSLSETVSREFQRGPSSKIPSKALVESFGS